MKENKEKITMATAYDYASAKVADDAGMEMILVGDSLGMVVLGYENTLGVTLAEMIHHGKAVVRAAKRAMVVIDLPFMTYQVTKEDALRNAGRAIQETGAPAVKLEGGEEMAKTVEKIVRAGIPVVGHIGLTPQSVGQMGGFVVQGKNERMARQLLKDALALEDAGACAVVLEGIPWQLGQLITEKITIPTIGIGAGVYCDGQVLVYHDILGLQTELRPKFVKQFGQFYHPMVDAMRAYAKEVKDAAFPAPEHTFTMDENIIERLREKF
ncbi:MAG: 3-methyl-2-oxobutanoate hydroxymethyltransferase [Firmicutes bacterium]|jgi:3-methyl-2-oxobutanoate hydroxymethyltransferase|nr:3-methyl-2-oxobutanoate hydroxymethyltransferase [Bacillota bacterium]MCL5994268.1 3-methyl-2-oxobutanoate hydroxymethyltransferase [Bacillota bacterium]